MLNKFVVFPLLGKSFNRKKSKRGGEKRKKPNPVVVNKATLNFCAEALSVIASSYFQCGTLGR